MRARSFARHHLFRLPLEDSGCSGAYGSEEAYARTLSEVRRILWPSKRAGEVSVSVPDRCYQCRGLLLIVTWLVSLALRIFHLCEGRQVSHRSHIALKDR
jgi:hypothetical protein